MTAKINISNLGNSLALPIPDYIVKFFNLKADDSVFLFFFRSFNSRFRDIHHYDFGVARILN